MSVFQRQMFANGDEVKFTGDRDDPILVRRPDGTSYFTTPAIDRDATVNADRLIQYYTAQGYSPAEVTRLLKEQFPQIETATVMDKMLEARELFPVDTQTMPPSGMMDDIGGIGPKEIQFGNASTMDFSVALEKIKSGNARTEEIYALYNTPGVKLGSEVKSAVENFIKQDQPELLKKREIVMGSGQGEIFGEVIPIEALRDKKFRTPEEGIGSLFVDIPATYQSTARSALGGIGEFAREGLEGASDFFLGERAGDLFRADQYGGDRDFFLRSGGRTPSEVNRMVMGMNDPEQSVSPIGFIGDSISDALDRFGINTDFFSKDPSEMILETDTVQRKKFEEAQIQEQINNVSDAAEEKGQPDDDTPRASVIEVEEDSGDGEGAVQDDTPRTEEQITSEEAPKRNFAEFIQSPDFIRFARNIGKGLATTGQIGQGIALGAAGAAEEKYAEEVAATEAETELLKEAVKKSGEGDLKPSELQALNKSVNEMSVTIKEFEGSEASIGIMNELIDLFNSAQEQGVAVTGLGGQVNIFADKLKTFFGQDFDSSDATKIQQAINQVKQRSIREILNESGRTISDLDRQIVDKIFGEIDFTTPPDQIIKKLNKARNDLIKNNADKKRQIETTFKTVSDPIYGIRGQNLISSYLPTINKILASIPGQSPSGITLSEVRGNPYAGTGITFLDRSPT